MNQPSQPNTTDWSWLMDTYWYVPAESLSALRYNPKKNRLTWVADQTVWHITGYLTGYFWGVTAVMQYDTGKAAPARPTGLVMFGSITPEGSVHVTFTPDVARLSLSSTVGIGRAIPHDGGPSLEMQMSMGMTETLAHWAYMVRTTPSDPSWTSLPAFLEEVADHIMETIMTIARRILIIDDDDDAFLETYQEILSAEGYDVETATTRAQALVRLDEPGWGVGGRRSSIGMTSRGSRYTAAPWAMPT